MRIRIDTHTHSVASGHAYSTIDELAKGARRRGLRGFVLTDHGPGMPGGTHIYHFGNLRILPARICGVRFFTGVEANIMDADGRIDLAGNLCARLDFVLAGFHDICYRPRSQEENTKALVAALANPLVDAVSHPGNPLFPVNQKAVVKAAVEHGKALEINNSSFRIRKGSEETCASLAELCASEGALVVCGSDAHYWRDVGKVATALAVIKAAGIQEDHVVNATERGFIAFLEGRKAARIAAVARSTDA